MANETFEWIKSRSGGWGILPLPKSKRIRVFKVIEQNIPESCDKNYEIKISFITKKGITKSILMPISYLQEYADFYIPESKYINCDDVVVRAVATPMRQYAKVLTLDNIFFKSPFNFKLPEEVSEKISAGVSSALEHYNDPYPSYYECYRAISNGEAFSRAFNKKLMLTIKDGAAFPVIYLRDNLLGYDNGDRIICSKSSIPWQNFLLKTTNKEVVCI